MSDGHRRPEQRPPSPSSPDARRPGAAQSAWRALTGVGLTAIVAGLVLIGAAALFVWLQVDIERQGSASVQLAQLEAGAQQISALEWRLSAERRVTPEIEWALSRARGRIATLLAGLPPAVFDEPEIQSVVQAYRTYVRGVDHELDLERLGLREEAEAYDAKVVDPSFERLLHAIDRGVGTFTERTRRASTVARWGSMGALLVALLAMAVLAWRASRSQRRANAAEERGRAWQASERVLREMFDSHPQAMWIADAESDRLVVANAAALRLYGYDGAAFLRLRVTDVCERGLSAADLRRGAGAAPGYNALGGREHRRRDGSALHVELDVMALDHDERPAVLALVRDRTEQHRLESRVREAQRMETVGRLANGVAHDFNNLVTAIVGYTQLLLNDLQGAGAAGPRAHAHEIWKAARRATVLTRQLLTFGHPSPGGVESLDVGQVVRELQPMLTRLLGEDVAMTARVQPGSWVVRGDRGHLEQVLVNLAMDVREGLRSGGHLAITVEGQTLDPAQAARVGARAPGDHVSILVSDAAWVPAPPPATPLSAATESTPAIDGRLALVTELLGPLGGALVLEGASAQGPFRLLLPCEGAVAAYLAPPAAAARVPAAQHATILLVEDDAAVRDMTRQVLVAHGHRVLLGANAEQALAVAGAHHGTIDLMVTDVVMPGVNGRQLAERLAQDRPEMLVLYISGYTEDEVLRRMVDDGHLEFLAKPFGIEELEQRVAALLESRRAAA